ncbi:hypothetical protein [uncultured Bradyrhizobium sp.]|uniref:hypothetical protein n=1 Tax=uncultured Bradyrhizobium sp. TaxID=199684 RepID=UPI00261EC0F6|nr:hypothetical protein [uncultured Bradyrhizobium sp.]
MAEGNALNFWSPDHENQFQTYMAFDPGVRQWRNAFSNTYGEPPQIDGGNFNYREAYLAGNGPKANAHDVVPHWSSTGKSKDHPTAWKETFVQTFGVDPDDLQPEQWTPLMQQFMQREIGGNTLGGQVRNALALR